MARRGPEHSHQMIVAIPSSCKISTIGKVQHHEKEPRQIKERVNLRKSSPSRLTAMCFSD